MKPVLILYDWTWPHLLDKITKGMIVLSVAWHAQRLRNEYLFYIYSFGES